MSKNSMPALIATLLIATFVDNTAFAQAANYQPYRLVGHPAKPQRAVRIQPKNTLSHNAVSRNRVTQISSYCRFEHGEKDPDPRVRLQLARDCRFYEEDTSD
jgi:hypothetical protein